MALQEKNRILEEEMKACAHVLIAILVTASGCSKKDETAVFEWNDSARIESEILDLEQIRDFIYQKLSENNVSRKEFLKAFSSNSMISTAELLRCSIEEVEELTGTLYRIVQNREDKSVTPDLDSSGRNENLEFFIDNYNEILPKLSHFSGVALKIEQRVSCAYGQYSACLMLAAYGAAATGGAALLVYGGGSYLCLCSYCRGGWTSWACF
jgi:hypothetical protein